MYRVIKDFTDLRDERHVYRVGDEYPRSGTKADADRIAELEGDENAHGEPVIELIPEKKERKKNVRGDSGTHS